MVMCHQIFLVNVWCINNCYAIGENTNVFKKTQTHSVPLSVPLSLWRFTGLREKKSAVTNQGKN